ncbi:unnamed protein product [Tuber melanosporum]|jgi:hypothetical protein|uniref:(Perigord truffle) hypothetical protein n=1 Tax=Tuber melanosporum (strain Mel28) TaxID=656061 RepID=D5GP01_TUBMM|nr:uncharacterized protein GSTUM_00011604001 [Tuber melanosporum]CAZ86244.1 unnamed protein product [Tuber melanosporum]
MQLKYLVALLLPALAAAEKCLNYVITFQPNTPDSVIEQAIATVKDNGGRVTHVYKIIKGFCVCAPHEALNQVSIMASEWEPVIEEDTVITTVGIS